MTPADTQPASALGDAPVRRPSSGSQRLYAIEIARGVACGAVLVFHSLTTLPPETLHPAVRFIRQFTNFGWLGVSVFFAASGWCIAERLAAAWRRGETPGAFLRERALRIYPTYWAALALMVAVRLVAAVFNGTLVANNVPNGALAWLGDLLLIQTYLGTSALLFVSWSLVYELTYYAMGGGALALRRWGCSTVGVLLLGALLMVPPVVGWNFRATFALGCWPDFFAGALAWFITRGKRDRTTVVAGVIFLVIAGATALGGDQFGGLPRKVAMGTATFFGLIRVVPALAVTPNRWFGPFAWLGGISYSLYLIHVTVLSPYTNFVLRHVHPEKPVFCFLWLVGLALATVAGVALHWWVEAPVERWRKIRWRHPAPVDAT